VLSLELDDLSSSLLLKNAQKIQPSILKGLKEKPDFFPCIISLLALADFPCQSSSIGFIIICKAQVSFSSSFENALSMLFIGSASRF
jgi:hypothetical protein